MCDTLWNESPRARRIEPDWLVEFLIEIALERVSDCQECPLETRIHIDPQLLTREVTEVADRLLRDGWEEPVHEAVLAAIALTGTTTS